MQSKAQLSINISGIWSKYYGELKNGAVDQTGNIAPSFGFNYEAKKQNIGLYYQFGNYSYKSDLTHNFNAIKTKFHNISINYNYQIFNSKPKFYLGLAVGYMINDNFMDSLDMNQNQYFVWSDGTIRNMAENNSSSAKILNRDYVYETKIQNENLIQLHFIISSVMPISERFSVKGSFEYRMNFNQIQYYANSTVNVLFGVQYKITGGWKQAQINKQKLKEFDRLIELDSDNDTHPDFEDEQFSHTKNKNGSDVDTDHDGIPDYRDKEPQSETPKYVDVNGVSLNYNVDDIYQKIQDSKTIIELESIQIDNQENKDYYKDLIDKKIEQLKAIELYEFQNKEAENNKNKTK